MVTIPYCVKDLLKDQGIFVVGSVGDTKICTISPRVFFDITKNSIYWLDFFKHKSYQNFKENPWVSIAVFDKDEFVGYQLRGKVSFLTENSETEKIRKKIVQQTLQIHKSKKATEMSTRTSRVIMFEPKVIYSMKPEEHSDLSMVCEADPTQLLLKMHEEEK